MKRPLAVILASFLLAAGCGKKGPILPPLARIPQPPEVLKLAQQGTHIVLEWKNPETYVDGRPLPGLSRIEVWMAEPEAADTEKPLSSYLDKFEDRAVLQAVIRQSEFNRYRSGEDRPPGILRTSLTNEPHFLNRKLLIFGLRAVDVRQRKSPFSSLLGVRPKPLPRPPAGVRAEAGPEAVSICWEPPRENIDGSTLSSLAGYRVFRADAEKPFVLLNPEPVEETCFQDRTFQFGRTYRYVVRTVASATEPFDESDDSMPLEVTPEDTFPPAPPERLTTLPGEDFITLAWDPGPEIDLAGYRVWRREEGRGDFEEITPQLLVETTYTDREVEKGRRYEYAITAEDQAGNRSPFSASAVEFLRAARG